MSSTVKIVIACVVAVVVGVVLGSLSISPSSVGGTVENFPTQFVNGLKAGSKSQLTVSSAGALSTSGSATVGALTASGITATAASVVNGASTSTVSVGSSAIGSKPGKLCLWNGTQFSVLSFAAGTTTVSVATSTSCL